MLYAGCFILERYVNPLFEVFDGGDFILSSYRDIEESLTQVRIYFEDASLQESAVESLRRALDLVGLDTAVETGSIPDEDWRLAYRRHFKTEKIGSKLLVVPEWEFDSLENPEGRKCIVLDPGMAFGTGKHETTRACLEFIEKVSSEKIEEMSFLDMGCGSGILSIAASKLGFGEVEGFDVDQEAVDASVENAEKNQVEILFRKFALGGLEKTVPDKKFDVVAANILGPLLIRFSEEIIQYVGDKLIISGILTEIYDEVLSCYSKLGMKEIQRITIGQWTTGLLFKEQ